MRPIPDTASCKRYVVFFLGFPAIVGSQLVRGSSSRRHPLCCLVVERVCLNLTGRGKHRTADVFGLELWGERKMLMLGLEMVPDGPGW